MNRITLTSLIVCIAFIFTQSCNVVPVRNLTGAYGAKDKVSSQDVELFNKVKALDSRIADFVPKNVKKQVVAGMNYMYVCTGSDKKKHTVVIFKPLPNNGEPIVKMIDGDLVGKVKSSTKVSEPVKVENTTTWQKPTTIKTLPFSIDLSNLEDGIYPVAFAPNHIEETEAGIKIRFQIFNHDLYDAIELNTMKIGDTIQIRGKMVRVDSLSRRNEALLVNGQLDFGGTEFYPIGGGCYEIREWDNHSTYTPVGYVTLIVPYTIDFPDRGNVSESMDGKLIKGSELASYLRNLPAGKNDFYQLNTRIRIEAGKIVEFYRIYIP